MPPIKLCSHKMFIASLPLATRHKCITGVLNWHHGTYTVDQTANSTTLTPFGHGYPQIRMFVNRSPTSSRTVRCGVPMFCKSSTPVMNHRKSLCNVTSPVGSGSVKAQKKNGGGITSSLASAGLVVATFIVALAGGFAGPLFF